MFSRSEATPEQLAVMTRVLSEFCASNGIQQDSAGYEKAARRILFLHSTGVTDEGTLAEMLVRDYDSPASRP